MINSLRNEFLIREESFREYFRYDGDILFKSAIRKVLRNLTYVPPKTENYQLSRFILRRGIRD